MPKFDSWRTCIALSFLAGALTACGGSSGDSSTGGSSTASSNTVTSTNKTDATSTSPGNTGDADVRFAP